MKVDRVIPSKAEEVRAYATMLEDREPLTITQLLLDLEYGKDLVDSVLSKDKDGDSNVNGANIIDNWDRDNASTGNGRDIKNNASC